MARGVRVQTRGRRGPGRLMDWAIAITTNTGTGLAAGALASIGASFATLGFLEPFTIIRTRGWLTISTDQVAASEDQVGAFGITIVQARALAAGTGSMPRPFSDPLANWFVWLPFSQNYQFRDATGAGINSVGYMIDSKAMRRVQDPNELGIAAIVENGESTDGLLFVVNLRFLVKFS